MAETKCNAPLQVFDHLQPDGCDQIGFASLQTTDEDPIVRADEEISAMQLPDQSDIDVGSRAH